MLALVSALALIAVSLFGSARPAQAAPSAPGNLVAALTAVLGTADPGSTITVRRANGTTVVSGQAASDGVFYLSFAPALPSGTPLFVTATDSGGVDSAASPVTAVQPPSPADPTSLHSNGAVVTGSGVLGNSIVVRAGTTVTSPIIGTGVVGADGTFRVVLSSVVADGVTIRVAQRIGNVGSQGVLIVVDAVPPAEPVVAPSNGEAVSGSAEPGSTVTVIVGGAVVGSGAAGADGTFAITLGVALSNGTVVTATATDAAGNVSAESDPVTVVVPAAPTPTPSPTPVPTTAGGPASPTPIPTGGTAGTAGTGGTAGRPTDAELADTGSAVDVPLVAAALTIALGVVVMLAARRSPSSARPTERQRRW